MKKVIRFFDWREPERIVDDFLHVLITREDDDGSVELGCKYGNKKMMKDVGCCSECWPEKCRQIELTMNIIEVRRPRKERGRGG